MMNLLSTLLHPTAEDERNFASCEGLVTERGTPLHLREVYDGGMLYFGGGLLEDGIRAACGAEVNWDDHFYSQIELEATLPLQSGGFHFCPDCLSALHAN
jgi:hypothetical protein